MDSNVAKKVEGSIKEFAVDAADKRGHKNATIGGGTGGLFGGLIGSFGGPLGTAIGAALGGVLGHLVGESRDNEEVEESQDNENKKS